ncbi:MAG: hypothetical protein C0594_03975, partial [Marinilabiliales bacterium]
MKVFFIIAFLCIVTATFSQKLQLQNSTFTDVDGNVYDLFDELESGKTVVIDFFSYYCSTCQENTPVLDSIWQTTSIDQDV